MPRLVEKGCVFSGKAKGHDIMQIMELPGSSLLHGLPIPPELTSRLQKPAELFYHLIKTALELKTGRTC